MEAVEMEIISERIALENLALCVVPAEYYFELHDNIGNESDSALLSIIESFL